MREEVNIDQFRTRPAEPVAIKSEGFAPTGKTVDPEAAECVARVIVGRGGLAKHEIRLTTDGGRRPFDYAQDDPVKLNARSPDGTMKWSFARVTEDVYVLYRRYLQTQDPSFLREAQRSL